MNYPGTYLKTKPFEIRYKIVADFLGDVSDKTIVDLNCGEPLFKNYVKYGAYFANDVFMPDDISGIVFSQVTDDKVDIRPDILCMFGYGGGEYTNHPMESKTSSDTIVRLAKYNPEYIVIEMCQKWADEYKIMDNLEARLPEYKKVFEKRIEVEPNQHYHDKRCIFILENMI